jgi:hypothetical protein
MSEPESESKSERKKTGRPLGRKNNRTLLREEAIRLAAQAIDPLTANKFITLAMVSSLSPGRQRTAVVIS